LADVDNEIPIGFRLALFKSMTEQLLMAGAPRSVVVLNGTMAVILIFILHAWYIFPFNLIVHFGAVHLTGKDDQFFDCIKRYIHKKSYYCT